MEQVKERSATPTESGGSGAPPMFTDAQIRKLKIAVIGMGVVLLLGFALVIGRIVQLMNRSSAAQDAQSAAPAAAGLAPEARLALPAGAVIRTMSLAGNRLAVHYDSPAGGGIAIVDLASGRVVQRIQIGPAL